MPLVSLRAVAIVYCTDPRTRGASRPRWHSAASRVARITIIVNDRVIVQIGGQPPSELLRTIGIERVEKRGEV